MSLVIWKERVALIAGTDFSRDHLLSRLETAPTGYFGNFDFLYKRLNVYYRIRIEEH